MAEPELLSRANTADSDYLAEPFKGSISAKAAAQLKSQASFADAVEPLENEEDFMEYFLSNPGRA